MTERTPDFEDDKIRLWQHEKDASEDAPRLDHTVMDVNFETEEIYESRTYSVLPHPASVLVLGEYLAMEGRVLDQREQVLLVSCIFADTSMKVLSKRRLVDGRITYLVTLVNEFGRLQVERGEVDDDVGLHTFVAELERSFALGDLLGEPTVVSHEEWRRYTEGGSRR